MKKIVKLFIFMFICLLPIVGNAESKLNFEWKLEDNRYITDSDGFYYFSDRSDNILKYDKDGKLVSSNLYSEDYSMEEIYNDPLLEKSVFGNTYDLHYNSKDDKYFLVNYNDNTLIVFKDNLNGDIDIFPFEDNLELVEEYLGVEFTICDNLVKEGYKIEVIYEDEGNYIVYYGNDSQYFVGVYNKLGNNIFEYEMIDDYYSIVHVDNDNIYIIEEERIIKVYDLKGTLLDTFNIYNDLKELYPNDDYYLHDFQVNNNNIMLLYDHFYHVDQPAASETSKNNRIKDIFDKTKSRDVNYIFFKYRIENDMTLVTEKTGGSFTTERKIDEFDREYVELEITTQEGYVVDTITVKDIHGNEIEVIDNKFYMPSSDVVVSVTYKQGEYLPIPDTGLSQSITIILIGLILISLGAYTINYVRQE